MNKTPVIAIIDVGKTNKKLFLFNEEYQIVYENSARFAEWADEDGFPCENLESLRLWVYNALQQVYRLQEFRLKALNFAAYGASLVYLDQQGNPLAPLYNYLKPYPQKLKEKFYRKWGGMEAFALQTASPVLGSLNSGMQLYRIKEEKPGLFEQIHYALHLPQYLSYLITGQCYSELTSIGCHTHLWDFQKGNYHEWVNREGLLEKLPPLVASNLVVPTRLQDVRLATGIGLHDSSAALIPYLKCFAEPFVLISTGTWCISLNPFNQEPLTPEELAQDCLYFMQYQGQAVKASRLFAGWAHEEGIKKIAAHFHKDPQRYREMPFQEDLISGKLAEPANQKQLHPSGKANNITTFAGRDLNSFGSDEEAYHQLMLDLVAAQLASTRLVMQHHSIKRIFVDGGFSQNAIYMNLLAQAFPEQKVYAATIAQATATGAAMAIHKAWNAKDLPDNIVALKDFSLAFKS